MQVLKVPAGEWVLQNAAGSALGRQFIAIAKKKGVRTINLVCAALSMPPHQLAYHLVGKAWLRMPCRQHAYRASALSPWRRNVAK